MERTIVGHVTRLGYLYCVACYEKREHREDDRPVYADTSPHNAEDCDGCEKPLVEHWYVFPYVVTGEDDIGHGYVAILSAPTRELARERFKQLALDGDETLWGKGIVNDYDGSSFEQSGPGFYYNSRPCDCGEADCGRWDDTHDSLSVCIRWDVDHVPRQEYPTANEALRVAQALNPHTKIDVFE